MEIDKRIKIVFIDLDGTLIDTYSNKTFPLCTADMRILWNTWKALKEWAKGRDDWYVFIVTNQGGIGRGLVNEYYWNNKAEYIRSALSEYLGAVSSKYQVQYTYCTSDNKNDPFRKPNTGMLDHFISSQGLHDIPMNEIMMIGDASGKPGQFSDSDLQVAKNFGCNYLDVNDLG